MVKTLAQLILLVSFIYGQKPIEVISSEEIQNFGLKRFIDIFNYSGTSTTSTIDGNQFHLSSSNSDQTDIYVDGIKTDISILDSENFDLLPLSVSEIQRIEFYEANSVGDKIITINPAINFVRKKVTELISVNAKIDIFNEVNDPGPYRYTEKSSPNIDHHGPDAFVSISSKYDRFSGSVSHQFIEHRPLDERLQKNYERKSVLGENWPDILKNKTNLSLNYELKNHLFSILSSHISYDDYYFFKSIESERPINHSSYSIQLYGKSIFNRLKLLYSFTTKKTKSIEQNSSSLNTLLNLKSTSKQIQIDGLYQFKNDRLMIQYKSKNQELALLSKHSDNFSIAYLSQLNKTVSINSGLNYDSFTRGNTVSIDLLVNDYNFKTSYGKKSNLTHSEFIFIRQDTISFQRRIANVFRTSFSKRIKFIHSFFKLNYETSDLLESFYSFIYSGKFNFSDRTYTNFSLTWKSKAQNLFYIQLKIFAKIKTLYSIYPDFSLWMTARFYGKRSFEATNIKSQFLVDLGLNKSLWNSKIQLNLAVRNIFDSAWKSHPLGRDTDLTFEMGVSLLLSKN